MFKLLFHVLYERHFIQSPLSLIASVNLTHDTKMKTKLLPTKVSPIILNTSDSSEHQPCRHLSPMRGTNNAAINTCQPWITVTERDPLKQGVLSVPLNHLDLQHCHLSHWQALVISWRERNGADTASSRDMWWCPPVLAVLLGWLLICVARVK